MTLPTDRPFWADNGYGEIVRLRYSSHDSMHAPWKMFANVDDDEAPLIGERELGDWDDDRDALEDRLHEKVVDRCCYNDDAF